MRQDLKYILFVVVCVVFPLPPTWMLAYSIKPGNGILSYLPKWIPGTLTVSNYITVLKKYSHLSWGTNSLITVVCGTLTTLLLSSLAAYALGHSGFRERKLIYGMIATTLLIPIQTYMVLPYLMCTKISLFSTRVSTIFPPTASVTSILALTSFFKGLLRELEEAACIGGCGESMVFLKITLLLSRPVLSIVTILTSITNWNNFLRPMTAIRSDKMLTLPVGIAQFMGSMNSNAQLQYDITLVTCYMAIIPTMIVFLLLQRYSAEGIATPGIKG